MTTKPEILLNDWEYQINHLLTLRRANYWQFLKEWQEYSFFMKIEDKEDFDKLLIEKINIYDSRYKRKQYKRGTPAKDVQGECLKIKMVNKNERLENNKTNSSIKWTYTDTIRPVLRKQQRAIGGNGQDLCGWGIFGTSIDKYTIFSICAEHRKCPTKSYRTWL